MLKQILFIGDNKVGKTNLMLSVAKVLAKNNEVLIIDKNENIQYYFNYNDDIEKNKKDIIRENIDIKIGKDITESEFIDNNYDFILVETSNNDVDINNYDKVFFIQNYDKCNLVRNKNILNYFNKSSDFSNVHFVFNQMLNNTSSRDYMIKELIEAIRNKTQIINNEDIEIMFSEEDLTTATINKFNGNIRLKYYTNEYKKGIFQIINLITNMSDKEYRKIIEERRI